MIESALQGAATRADLSRDDIEDLAVPERLQGSPEEVAKTLAAQTDRLERLLVTDREWSVSNWRERFLDQPAVQSLVRRLIWCLEPGHRIVGWNGQQLVDVDDCPVAIDPGDRGIALRWLQPADARARTSWLSS